MNSKELIKHDEMAANRETEFEFAAGLTAGAGTVITLGALSETELRLLINNMISPFSYHRMVYDFQGNPIDYVFIDVNDAFERETGMRREEIIGKSVLEIFPETEKFWIERCGKVAKTGIPDHLKNHASALNGWYEVRVYSPQPDYFAMTVFNITESVLKQAALELSVVQLKEAKDKLFIERELLKTTLMSIGDGVICTDQLGRITMLNDVAAKLTGWTSEEVIGMDVEVVLNLINKDTREKVASPIARVLKTRTKVELEDHVLLISRQGKEHAIADCAAPIMESGRDFEGTVLVFRDVTEMNEKQREIEYLGYHDLLTGLYNRRFFEMELGRFDIREELPITFLMGDLNGLKFTNDTFGHDAGDALLVVLAEILKKCLRKKDIICRNGGDEFVAILPNTDFSQTGELVRQICKMVDDTKIDTGFLSVAFGWATKDDPTEDLYQVLKSAEDNMYKKKLHEIPSFAARLSRRLRTPSMKRVPGNAFI